MLSKARIKVAKSENLTTFNRTPHADFPELIHLLFYEV